MIIDSETNRLYLSDLLNSKYPNFCKHFTDVLETEKIIPEFLENTKDIWCRDFMPVQVRNNKAVLFDYHPKYLEKYPELITDAEPICKSIKQNFIKSKIKLDGGNIVKSKNKVIISEIIFQENPKLKKDELIAEIKTLFEVEEICLIPRFPYDDLSHADGAVRFIDENTVIVNKLKGTKESNTFIRSLYGFLGQYGLNILQIPYYPDYKKTADGINTANGCYINYLQVGDIVFLPYFGNVDQDEEAHAVFSKFFKKVVPVQSSEIAQKGGVLNCISWNIKK